jgi:hypothetical protein
MGESLLRRVARMGSSSSELEGAIASLTAAVHEVAATQRKQAVQLKKLLDAQKEQDHRWHTAIESWQKAAADRHGRDLEEASRAHEKLQKKWMTILGGMQESFKTEKKWRLIFSRQVDAMMRTLHLSRMPLAPPHDITARRFRLRSQNEEDGMILALLEHAGWTNQRFVEIGSGRSGGNAAMLAYECGWNGLMLDIVPAAIESLKSRFRHNPGVVAVAAEVTPANVNQLITDNGFAGEVDLLSIDIDSYDYWVLDALSAASPRLLMLEYNAHFGPEKAVTIPLNQSMAGGPKGYRGASLAALDKAARRKGYRLVACDPSGVNAFYLRNDVAPHVPGLPLSQAFRPALSRFDVTDEPLPDIEPDLFTMPKYPLVEV